MSRPILAVVLAVIIAPLLAAPAGCGGADTPQVEETRQPLFGDVKPDGATCTPVQIQHNHDIIFHGRVVAGSRAFRQCVERAATIGVTIPWDTFGPYRRCTGDPHYFLGLSQQIEKALAATRSPNNIAIKCSGGNPTGNASTDVDTYGKTGDEWFNWAGWFKESFGTLDKPLCNETLTTNCRYAAYPWPYSQAAGTAWHEVMHQQGYTHGANDSDNGRIACGYAGDATWDLGNSMPYIIGNCMDYVLWRSGEKCTAKDMVSCGPNKLELVDDIDGGGCSCHHDPRASGLGLMGLDDAGALSSESIHGHGEALGGWGFNTTDELLATGNFDGDSKQTDELIIRSSWGLGILKRAEDGSLDSIAMVAQYQWMGGWQLLGDDTIEGVGDFNADGRDDFIIRRWNRDKFAIVTLTSTGTLTTIRVVTTAQWMGQWNHGYGDTFEGIGDFDQDGADDILITSAWGLGIIRLTSSNTLTPLNMVQHGTWMGLWNYSVNDNKIRGVGDFDKDGRADFIIQSPWGLGIIQRTATGVMTHLNMVQAGTAMGQWPLGANDLIQGVGDYDGDEVDDFIIRSSTHLGIIHRTSSGTLSSIVRHSNAIGIGLHQFQGTDTLVGVGNFDDDKADEFVLKGAKGVGIIERAAWGGLWSLASVKYQGLMGSWLLRPGDSVLGVGDMDGDGRVELVLKGSPSNTYAPITPQAAWAKEAPADDPGITSSGSGENSPTSTTSSSGGLTVAEADTEKELLPTAAEASDPTLKPVVVAAP